MTFKPRVTTGAGQLGSSPPLPSLRFSLRQLFWFTTFCGFLLAAILLIPGPGVTPLALLLAAMVITFHLTATALGSQLRAHADRERVLTCDALPSAGQFRLAHETHRATVASATASPLHRRGLRFRCLPGCVGAGAAAGGAIGLALFTLRGLPSASSAGIAVGAVSCAIVGGWCAFLGGSFWAIFRDGWSQAVDEHRRDEIRNCRSRL